MWCLERKIFIMNKSLSLLLFLVAIGCSPKFTIQTDAPFPGDFDVYKTYKFYNPENMPASNFSFNETTKKVIFDAVADEMKAKGYKSIQDADLIIKIQGGTKSTIEIRNDNRYFPYDNFYGYNRFGRYNNIYDRPRDESKKESNIIIDFIDTKSEKIVWQGVGIGTFGKSEDMDELKVREAIVRIFGEYPYTAP